MAGRLFGVCVLAALSACGAPVVDQGKLKPLPLGGAAIEFTKEFRYDISAENDLPRPKPGSFRGLLPGKYSARYDDGEGIYYATDMPCVIYNADVESKSKWVTLGGVWIEKAKENPRFRLYWIIGKQALVRIPIDSTSACGEVPLPAELLPAGAASATPRDAARSGATPETVAQGVPNASPIQAGIGVGLAEGAIGALIQYERGKIVLMPAPLPTARIAGAYAAVPK